ncbi:Uncharacterised protein [Sphingobacterium multivorum]|uniref:Uncharacterized protein n=1 Tax=Sphingobacterium multivorum TaxID=28454 RepID=A0A2X2JJG8_SPHMU|nr:Uncharacterised protein [Sphingobacterium multivorum]
MICIVLHIKSNLSKFDKNKFTIQPIYMKFILFICLFFATQAIFGQNISVVNNESTLFELENPNGKIDFLVIDPDPHCKKPLFLFCQGSLPLPLYFNYKKKV